MSSGTVLRFRLHAGCLEYVFPKEAQAEDAVAISTEWLKENWQNKVYDGCTADKVTVIE